MDIDIPQKSHPSLSTINQQIEKQAEITSKRINKLALCGKVFLRGVLLPQNISRFSKHSETNWEIELRKTSRRIGKPTRSTKPDSITKDGNPNRSTTLFYPGISIFSPVGYGIIRPKIEDIKVVTTDMENYISGCGKKKYVDSIRPKDAIIDQTQDTEKKLDQLLEHIKNHKSNLYKVNEVLMDIRSENINFIYYLYDINHNDALYMQQIAKKLLGKDIPIFKYSSATNDFEKVISPT